jgi:membrane associated rhomboid family serine protease
MFPIRDTIPSRHPPVMTWLLIAAHVAAFAYELMLPAEAREAVFYQFGMVPARYTDPGWAAALGLAPIGILPFLTSMFLHGGLLHIVANMWTLWIFGDNVEDRMGSLRFLAFYLLCGLGAGALHWATNVGSTVPAIGASGAIAGVLGAYLLLYPHARVVTVLPVLFYPLIFELPAVLYLGLWFLIQIWSGFASLRAPVDVGGIAWWAHVGGFVGGMLLLALFKKKRLPPPRPAEGRHYVYGHPSERHHYRF